MKFVISLKKAIGDDQKSICLDFDGVIHSYRSGWQGETVIPDPPVSGTKTSIEKLRKEGWKVLVYSTRCKTAKGREAIGKYLQKNGIFVDEICMDKPAALIYVDDRGLKFNGKWTRVLREIAVYKNWLEVA